MKLGSYHSKGGGGGGVNETISDLYHVDISTLSVSINLLSWAVKFLQRRLPQFPIIWISHHGKCRRCLWLSVSFPAHYPRANLCRRELKVECVSLPSLPDLNNWTVLGRLLRRCNWHRALVAIVEASTAPLYWLFSPLTHSVCLPTLASREHIPSQITAPRAGLRLCFQRNLT